MASIQGNISTAVDTALATGLADINAAIAELEIQVEAVATSEEVDTITETLEGLETDLDDLLSSNNIFTGDLVINSEASLEFAENLKNRVDIINGSVFIEQSTDMDDTRLQAVASKIKTITGDLVVRAQASSVSGITLDSLAGVSNLKIAQPGSISFPLLTSVQEIIIGENFKVDGEVNFSSLKSVGKISSGNLGDATNVYNEYEVANEAANTINAPKASSINFGALAYYSPRTLTINGDDDTELHLSALETKDSNGKDRSYTITVKGAQALDAPGLVLGSITIEDVETVTLANYAGKVTLMEGVEHITVGALKNDFDATAAEDLVSATLTMDAKDKKADFSGLDDLETVSIEGKVKTVILSENNSLTDLMLSAAIESLTIHATNLVEAALDYTNANAEEKGALTLTNNDDLTSFSADQVDGLAHLTITGNSELTTISFDALETLPTKESVKPKVTIGGSQTLANDLNALSIDQNEADATKGGSFTTNAGLDDLKTYLTEAKKRVGSDLKVYFDRADEYRVDGEVQTAPSGGYVIGGSHDSQLAVINYAGQSGAVKSKRSWVILDYNGFVSQGVVYTLSAGQITKSTQALTATGTLNLFNELNDDEFKSAFDLVGTLTVSLGAAPQLYFRLDDTLPTSSVVTHTITSSVESATYFEIKIGDQSSKVYFTTTDDPSNDDEIISEDGKSITQEVVIAQGALSTLGVLGRLSDGLNKLFDDNNAPFYSEQSILEGYDVLTLISGDNSLKYHNSDKAKVSFNTNYDMDGSRFFDAGGVNRDRLYGHSIQVTLEAKTAGASVREGGPSEIGDPPAIPRGVSPDSGIFAGGSLFTTTATGQNGLLELSLNPDGDADNEDSPDYVAFGKEGEEGTDIDHISWL